jgi:hypothetical protein
LIRKSFSENASCFKAHKQLQCILSESNSRLTRILD